ncbi:MAG: hypothetical protein AAGK37_20705 [Pseudomonadota bacterium]
MLVFNIPYRLLLFACTTVLLIGCCLWIRFINMPILDELEARGEPAKAEVIWVGKPYWVWQRGNYSRGGWRIDMSYGYRTQADQWVVDEKTFVKQNATSLTVGRSFDVVYLPDEPEVQNSGYGNGYAGVGMIYALIPMVFVCAFMTLFYWRRRPQDWHGPRLWPPIRAA